MTRCSWVSGMRSWVSGSTRKTALHVRRRLSVTEVAMVGPVEDIRRTPEARERYLALPEEIRLILPEEIVRDEVGP